MMPIETLRQISIDGPWPVWFEWDLQYYDGGQIVMHVTRPDTLTGGMGTAILRSRVIPLNDASTIVRTAFGLYVGFCEHEAREAFQWKGRRVFGPHTAVQALWHAAAEQTEG